MNIIGDKNDPKRNGYGYLDNPAYETIKKEELEEQRFKKLLKTIHSICDIAGFEIENRIIFRDKETDRIWR